jgi:hypothetical protein
MSSNRGTALQFVAALMIVGCGAWYPSLAGTRFLAVDVPTRLGTADYLSNQIVRGDGFGYSVEVALPVGANLSALSLRPDGSWWLAFEDPITLDGHDFTTRDVARWDGLAVTSMLDGASAGIPQGTAIDAIAADATGALLLSFNSPTTIASMTYSRSDLARYFGGAFSKFWDAGAAGVPAVRIIRCAAIDPIQLQTTNSRLTAPRHLSRPDRHGTTTALLAS